jgi:hypothetical protein
VNRNPKISIAMATFEGSKYLVEQFNSLCAQTRQPDEVIVYDDASSDNTLDILREIEKTSKFPIKVIKGRANRGVNYAFEKASAACRGEYIFFCDQDDYWELDKIEKFISVFERDAKVGMIFCDATEMDAEGQFLSGSLWQKIGFTQRRRRNFEADPVGELIQRGNLVYGMSAAFRAEAIRPFYPIDADPRGMTHDTWFALHVMAMSWTGITIDEPLVRYRRHVNQATNNQHLDSQTKNKGSVKARSRHDVALLQALQAVIKNITNISFDDSNATTLEAVRSIEFKVSHILLREEVRKNKNVRLAVLAALSSGYWRHARGPLSVLVDLCGAPRTSVCNLMREFRKLLGGQLGRWR